MAAQDDGTKDTPKPKSLADFLGIDPPAPPAPAPDYENMSGQEFAKQIIRSFEFRSYLKSGLYDGNLPAAVVTKLMDHAWGKPADKLEFEDKTKALEALSPAELDQRIAAIRAVLATHEA